MLIPAQQREVRAKLTYVLLTVLFTISFGIWSGKSFL